MPRVRKEPPGHPAMSKVGTVAILVGLEVEVLGET
jgi:hypothetical protein